ncbi:hypothetical protein L1887_39303 [Cichorium endivia]|nr:hypothetical protein L1887_39303 [Cichorium endivia]
MKNLKLSWELSSNLYFNQKMKRFVALLSISRLSNHRRPLIASPEVTPFSSVSSQPFILQGKAVYAGSNPVGSQWLRKTQLFHLLRQRRSSHDLPPRTTHPTVPHRRLGPRDPSLTPLQAIGTGDRKLRSFSSNIASNKSAMKG